MSMPTVSTDAKTEYLFNILKPYLLQLLHDVPAYGEISLKAVLHDNDIARVSLGAEVTRNVSTRSARGE